MNQIAGGLYLSNKSENYRFTLIRHYMNFRLQPEIYRTRAENNLGEFLQESEQPGEAAVDLDGSLAPIRLQSQAMTLPIE